MTDEASAGTAADGPTLDDVIERAAAAGPPVCRWPACPRPAAPLAERGPGRRPGRAAPAAVAAGGRRPEFCSDAHRRRNGDAVRVLRGLVERAEELRSQARGRERRRAEAALADLVRRLALHGEPAAAPAPRAGQDRAAGRASAPRVGPARPGGGNGGLARVVALPSRPVPPAGTRVPEAGGGAQRPDNVIGIAGRRPAGPPGAGAGPGPVPVLALRRTTAPYEFAESWSRLRDAAESARAVIAAVRRASGADRTRLAAGVHLELAELAEAADQVLLDVSLLPAATATHREAAGS